MFLLASHAFLRIGKIVVRYKTADSSETLKLRQLTFTLKNKKISFFGNRSRKMEKALCGGRYHFMH